MKKKMDKVIYWKIKKEIMKKGGYDLLDAIQALVGMMDISIGDETFKKYADENPDVYKWFEQI